MGLVKKAPRAKRLKGKVQCSKQGWPSLLEEALLKLISPGTERNGRNNSGPAAKNEAPVRSRQYGESTENEGRGPCRECENFIFCNSSGKSLKSFKAGSYISSKCSVKKHVAAVQTLLGKLRVVVSIPGIRKFNQKTNDHEQC